MNDLLAQLPRLIYVGFSIYALVVLITRWRVTRVMTQDRRFLFLFFVLELATAVLSGALKLQSNAPADLSIWLYVFTQALLAAYLHHSVPASHRRWHHRFTRRR